MQMYRVHVGRGGMAGPGGFGGMQSGEDECMMQHLAVWENSPPVSFRTFRAVSTKAPSPIGWEQVWQMLISNEAHLRACDAR